MEARADVRKTGISRAFTGAVLVLIAAGLGLMGAFLAVNLGGGHATTQSTVTQTGGAHLYRATRAGAQVDDSGPLGTVTQSGGAHIYRATRSGAQIDDSGPVAPTPGMDARTIREGYGR